MIKRKIKVVNPTGLHLRPAGLLCQTSMKFKSKVLILYKDKEINAKSVLNVMASGIKCGTDIEVCCDGDDEEAAIESVCTLIAEGLKE
ncbi:MAG: HPr family phosphocarrier protein [Lachnospiraceae bacterium]|nr:HPr family phosphocarrier protein [Lachnospiraceae bacterium]